MPSAFGCHPGTAAVILAVSVPAAPTAFFAPPHIGTSREFRQGVESGLASVANSAPVGSDRQPADRVSRAAACGAMEATFARDVRLKTEDKAPPSRSVSQRRKEVVRRLRSGTRVKDVCKEFVVSKTAVFNWKRAASEGGLRALAATEHRIPQSRLSVQQKRQLQAVLRGGASACGCPVALWMFARVVEVIE